MLRNNQQQIKKQTILGKRKAPRPRDSGSNVDRLLDWFHQLAEMCEQKRAKQQECALSGGAHRTLRSVLVTNQIDVTKPIEAIVRAISEDLPRTHPVVRIFALQWKAYVQALYAGCSVEAQQRRAVDPQWFEKQVAQITFATVFYNPLWRHAEVHKDTVPFDTLSETATVVKRRPEEMLAASECIRTENGNSNIDAGRIMDHVVHRLELARTQAQIARLQEWDAKTLQQLVQRQTEFALVDPNPLLSPRSAREALMEQVETRMQGLRRLDGAELKEAFEFHLPKVGKQFLEEHTTDLAAKEKQFERKIRHRLQFLLITSWCSQILRHWTIPAGPTSKPIQDILSEEESSSNSKRVRLFQDNNAAPAAAAAEQKAVLVGTGILQDIAVVLSRAAAAESNNNLDRLLMDTLGGQVLPILQKRLATDSSQMDKLGDITAEREALGHAAVVADLGAFMLDLSERGKLNPLVVNQQQRQLLKTPAIDQLVNEYETQLVEGALRNSVACRQGFLEIHAQLLAHLRKTIHDPVQAKLAQLQTRLSELRERVIVAEPWFDMAVISPEMRRDLEEIVKEPTEVGTVSQALNKAQTWFSAALVH